MAENEPVAGSACVQSEMDTSTVKQTLTRDQLLKMIKKFKTKNVELKQQLAESKQLLEQQKSTRVSNEDKGNAKDHAESNAGNSASSEEIATLQSEILSLKEILLKTENDNKTMTSRMKKALSAQQTQLKQAKNEVAEHANCAALLDSAQQALAENVKKTVQAEQQFKDQLALLELSLKDASEEAEHSSGEREKVKSELDAALSKMKELQKKFNQLQSSSAKVVTKTDTPVQKEPTDIKATELYKENREKDIIISELKEKLGLNKDKDAKINELNAKITEQENKIAELDQKVVGLSVRTTHLTMSASKDKNDIVKQKDETDARLVKAFHLLKEEKTKSEETAKALVETEKRLNTMRTKMTEIVRQQQVTGQQKSSEIQQLKADIQELQHRLVSVSEERSYFEKECQAMTESNKELEIQCKNASMDKENEVNLKQQLQYEFDAARASWTSKKEQFEETAVKKLEDFNADLQKEIARCKDTLTHTEHALNQSNIEKRELSKKYDINLLNIKKFEERIKELTVVEENMIKKSETAMQAMKKEFQERYVVLENEYNAYKDQTSSSLQNQATMLKETRLKCQKLEDELTSGKPGERRFVEIARLQARRDDMIFRLQKENDVQKKQLNEANEALLKEKEEKEYLRREVDEFVNSKDRSSVDMDYLKNVVLRYMQFETKTGECQSLVPVIARLLKFNKTDVDSISQTFQVAGSSGTASAWNLYGLLPTQLTSTSPNTR